VDILFTECIKIIQYKIIDGALLIRVILRDGEYLGAEL